MPIIDDAKAESYEKLMGVVTAGNEQFLDDEGRACYMRKADCVSTNYDWFPRNTLTQFKAHWGSSSLIRQDVCKLARQIIAHRERIAADWTAVAGMSADSMQLQEELELNHNDSLVAFAEFMAALPQKVKGNGV